MLTGIKAQAILLVLTALILDGGHSLRAFSVALLCQWATVFLILLRRSKSPTKLDLQVVRYGILPLLLAVVIFGPTILTMLGISQGVFIAPPVEGS